MINKKNDKMYKNIPIYGMPFRDQDGIVLIKLKDKIMHLPFVWRTLDLICSDKTFYGGNIAFLFFDFWRSNTIQRTKNRTRELKGEA